MSRVDRLTRRFWRVTGQPVDLGGAERWLAAPMLDGDRVGDTWLHAAAGAQDLAVLGEAHGDGLLKDMSRLDGPCFRAAELRSEVRDFYEHTSNWRMEVWTQWNPLFQPAGRLVSRLFGRRVQQLALPARALDGGHHMDSRIVVLAEAGGEQRAAAWLRTLRSTGEYVYSGLYSIRELPGSSQASIHVAFPLQAGNVQVFLRPAVLPGGALGLSSPAGGFGEDGAYVVVEDQGTHGARAPIHEDFLVYVDDGGVLRADHTLRLWGTIAVRLHYRMVSSPWGS